MNPTARPPHFSIYEQVAIGLLLSLPLLLTGCTMCQNCGDLDYPTYGGAWQRTRRDGGRVGSIFDPAGARTATLSNRDTAADDPSLRSPRDRIDPLEPDKSDPDKKKDADDPKDDAEPSPSDRSKDQNRKADGDRDKLRDLDLEDIQYAPNELVPPDV